MKDNSCFLVRLAAHVLNFLPKKVEYGIFLLCRNKFTFNYVTKLIQTETDSTLTLKANKI